MCADGALGPAQHFGAARSSRAPRAAYLCWTAAISLDQNFSSAPLAPLRTQHHRAGGGGIKGTLRMPLCQPVEGTSEQSCPCGQEHSPGVQAMFAGAPKKSDGPGAIQSSSRPHPVPTGIGQLIPNPSPPPPCGGSARDSLQRRRKDEPTTKPKAAHMEDRAHGGIARI